MTLASVVALAVTIPSMAERLERRPDHTRWASVRTAEDTFEFFVPAIAGSIEFGQTHATLRWGEDSVEIPITGESYPGMSGLRGHSQWIAILALASIERGDIEELESGLADGSIVPRLTVVTRETPDEIGPDGWGDASTKSWRYRFWELTPNGRIEPYVETRTHMYYGSEIEETGFLSYRAISYMPDSWQFAAAMQVTPSLHTPAARSASPMSYPNFVNVREALGAMGWTWPVAGVSILTLISGGLLLAGSFVRRDRHFIEAEPA